MDFDAWMPYKFFIVRDDAVIALAMLCTTPLMNDAVPLKSNYLPTVSMAVLGYNHERTISYAIDSALAQDYPETLTLIFSDDCSQDGTFRIMKEKAATYRGPHRIILNRNETNLKYAENLMRALDLACKQDGDDYSAPYKVSMLVGGFVRYPHATYGLGWVRKKSIPSF